MLAMFSDLIRSPSLPQQKIDLYKAQVRGLPGQSETGARVTGPACLTPFLCWGRKVCMTWCARA